MSGPIDSRFGNERYVIGGVKCLALAALPAGAVVGLVVFLLQFEFFLFKIKNKTRNSCVCKMNRVVSHWEGQENGSASG